MGSIKLDNLRNSGKAATGHTYVDLHLDIKEATVATKLTKQRLTGKDIAVDYDVDAIMNSLTNIFNTIPGERFLIPRFGANLRKYLFDPVSEAIGNAIGNEIVRAIELWEPRVTVDRVTVIGRPEPHEYEVTIIITINALKQQVAFNGILNQDTNITIRDLSRVCPN